MVGDSSPGGGEAVANVSDLLDDPDYQVLWDALAFDAKPVDLLIEQTGLSASSVSSMLLMMELRGMVKKQGTGRYLRA